MTALLIDAGNTRIKWAFIADAAPAPGAWLAHGAATHAGLAADAGSAPAAATDATAGSPAGRLATAIAASLAAAGGADTAPAAPIARVLIANVAGDKVRDLLAAALQAPPLSLAPETVEWFASLPERAGMKNAYRNPYQLGCDRFAAAIGAHALCPGQAIIVANCGTATTIDAITRDGTFLGGMILPGLGLMATSLEIGRASCRERV